MQPLTVQITNNSALKTLHSSEDKRFIKIVKSPGFVSPSPLGKEMDLPAFEAWISDAENVPTVSLKEAKSRNNRLFSFCQSAAFKCRKEK